MVYGHDEADAPRAHECSAEEKLAPSDLPIQAGRPSSLLLTSSKFLRTLSRTVVPGRSSSISWALASSWRQCCWAAFSAVCRLRMERVWRTRNSFALRTATPSAERKCRTLWGGREQGRKTEGYAKPRGHFFGTCPPEHTRELLDWGWDITVRYLECVTLCGLSQEPGLR